MRYLIFLCCLLVGGPGVAKPLFVAAAADLSPCIEELNQAFAKKFDGGEVKHNIGASGNLYAQIRNGAPFHVFLSADTFYPRELAKSGLADSETLTVYAYGQLVMWSVFGNLPVENGWRVLQNTQVQRIAIANPDIAPYGRAAKAALEKAGLWQALRGKYVMAENVAQTAQFVQSGNAQIGFISAAQAGMLKGRRFWKVPADSYPPIEQSAIVTEKGKSHPLARRYVEFLRSDEAQAIFSKHGFSLSGKLQ